MLLHTTRNRLCAAMATLALALVTPHSNVLGQSRPAAAPTASKVEDAPSDQPRSSSLSVPSESPHSLAPTTRGATPIAASAPVVPIRAYGILWAAIFTTQPVQSYGLPTATAPTSAINRALYPRPDHMMLSFQVQQTRAGVVVGEGTPFKGTLEVDFIHFEQSTPFAQAYPRIRVGLLEWQFRERQKLFLGQTWDVFGNATGPQLLSHSFNLVGTLFQAGNIGFMRQQLGWSGLFGQVELVLALGMQGANTGPTFNNLEESATPTGAGRLMLHLPQGRGVLGLSGIGTSLRFNRGAEFERRAAFGALIFTDSTWGAVNLHGELYVAQNLANTGALNLSQGRYGADLRDAGGYLSAKLTLGKHAITAMAGSALMLNPAQVVPGYTPRSMGPAAISATPLLSAGPGIRHNTSVHLGYWYSPIKGLSIVLEPYLYATRFQLAPADAGRVSSKNLSWGGSLGSMFQF